MFCKRCGAQMGANAAFCGNCGTKPERIQPPVQQTYSQPPVQTYAQPTQPTYPGTQSTYPGAAPGAVYVPGGKVKKNQFLKSFANARTKLLGLIAMIVMIVTIGSLVAGGLSFAYGDIRDIPLVKKSADSIGIDLHNIFGDEEKMEDMATASIDELVEEIEDSGDLDGVSEREIKKMAKALKAFIRTPSIMNTKRVYKLFADSTAEVAGMSEISDSVMTAINGLLTVMFFLFALPALFALLAGLKKSIGWSVTAIIFSLLPLTTFALPGWMILGFIALIAQLVLNVMITGEYKKFRGAV